jgi:hypothetical protein
MPGSTRFATQPIRLKPHAAIAAAINSAYKFSRTACRLPVRQIAFVRRREHQCLALRYSGTRKPPASSTTAMSAYRALPSFDTYRLRDIGPANNYQHYPYILSYPLTPAVLRQVLVRTRFATGSPVRPAKVRVRRMLPKRSRRLLCRAILSNKTDSQPRVRPIHARIGERTIGTNTELTCPSAFPVRVLPVNHLPSF